MLISAGSAVVDTFKPESAVQVLGEAGLQLGASAAQALGPADHQIGRHLVRWVYEQADLWLLLYRCGEIIARVHGPLERSAEQVEELLQEFGAAYEPEQVGAVAPPADEHLNQEVVGPEQQPADAAAAGPDASLIDRLWISWWNHHQGPLSSLQQWQQHMASLTVTNFDEFFPPGDGNKYDLHSFLSERGLVLLRSDGYSCPNCGPNQPLSVCNDNSEKFGFNLKCVRGPHHCNLKVTPCKDTWFEDSKLTIHQEMGLLLFFALDLPVTLAATNFGVTKATAIKHYSMCREACAIRLLDDLASTKLGGPGRVVEIDESLIVKNKYHRGRVLQRQNIWILGGIDRSNRRAFVCLTKKRDRETLFSILTHFIDQGTTIVSDQWRAYNGVERLLQGSHVTVNHSQCYVDPRHQTVHTNTVERFWKGVKNSVHSFQETAVETHVLTACFRHQFMETPFDQLNPNGRRVIKSPGELLDIMMETIGLVYPGLGLPEIHIPQRILVRQDAHPFPHLGSMIVMTPGPFVAMPPQPLNNLIQPTALAVIPPLQVVAAVNAQALATSLDVNFILGQNLRSIEYACEFVLGICARTAGCYDSRQSLTVALTPYEFFVRSVIVLLRQHQPKHFNARIHLQQIYQPLEAILARGVLQAMRPISTVGAGDCLFSSVSMCLLNDANCIATVRLSALSMVLKYFLDFDTVGMRAEIGIHHGPDGACSLLRSLGGLGSQNLQTALAQAYPNLALNYHYASSASILAVSIAVKKRLTVFQHIDNTATGPIPTIGQFIHDFEVLDQVRLMNHRRYTRCKTIRGSVSYNSQLRVYHANDHFVALLPYPRLAVNSLIPAHRITLQINLAAEDV